MFASLKYIVKCILGACASFIGWDTKLSFTQTVFGVVIIGAFWLVAILSYYLPIKAGNAKTSALLTALCNLLACVVVVVLLSCLIDLVRYLWTLTK